MNKLVKEMTVCVTGAAGKIANSFIPFLLNGTVFGNDVKIHLKMLDIPQTDNLLRGFYYELQDSMFPLCTSVEYGYDPKEMFKDIDVGIFFGGFPRKPGMDRSDLLRVNGKNFKEQAQALNEYAKDDCKVITIANPLNTLTYILMRYCPKLPKKNFLAVTRLDLNRAVSQISRKAKVSIDDIKNVMVWGNHSATQYPDVTYGTIKGKPIKEVIKDDKWLQTEFIKKNQNRGTEVLNMKKSSSVFSAAKATVDHIKDLYFGRPDGSWNIMGVFGNEEYPIKDYICCSYPTICKGKWEFEIVKGLKFDDFSTKKIAASIKELQDEQNDVDVVI